MEDAEKKQNWKFKIRPLEGNKLYKGEIILYYGPHEAVNVTKHRPQRLRGLKDMLINEGYLVKCIPWEHYDRMAVMVNETIIYTCRYSYMDFDGFGEDRCTKEAFKITMETLNRLSGWYLMKHFHIKNPYDFFNSTISD